MLVALPTADGDLGVIYCVDTAGVRQRVESEQLSSLEPDHAKRVRAKGVAAYASGGAIVVEEKHKLIVVWCVGTS